MIAQKKKAMMMFMQSRLPSGYRRLAYIEASGEQYIDLDMTDLTRFVVAFAFTPGGSTGGIVSVSGYQGRFLAVLNEGARIGLNASDASQCFAAITLTERNTFDGVITSGDMTVDCGDETITRVGTNAARHPILFGMYIVTSGEIRYLVAGKMFAAQLWQTGTTGNPYRDLVPAERVSDGAVGMYDQINNVFLTNAGTGTFGKGPYV